MQVRPKMSSFLFLSALFLIFLNGTSNGSLQHRSSILNRILSRPSTISDFQLPSPSSIDEPPSSVDQYHGTTTLAFINGENIIVCVDSKASLGNYVGSRSVNKILPITDSVVATMAGGAADCLHWIREVSRIAKVMEFDNGEKLRVIMLAKLLASKLRQYRNKGLSVGTMVAGIDDTGPSCKCLFLCLSYVLVDLVDSVLC